MAFIPDHPDQPPGARNLVRILAERLRAYDAALSTGDDIVVTMTPRHWSGPASDAFTGTALPRIDTERRKIAAINQSVTARVEGYSTFIHNLPELWVIYGNDPAELSRLRLIWEDVSGRLASELMAWAAELDNRGHVDLPDPAVIAVPEVPAKPVSHWARPDPVVPQIEHTAVDPLAPAVRHRDAAAGFTPPFVAVRLRQQMLSGERRDHIPWPG